MIFRRSLVRELTATTIGLFLVLLAILFTNLVLRILARAAGGAVAPEGVLPLLGFATLFYLNILLSVALFLTVLLTLSRWYRDSEMIVWFTSGQSLTACLRPILLFAAPFLVAIVLLSLYLSPWAEQRRLEYERQLESRDEIVLRVSPRLAVIDSNRTATARFATFFCIRSIRMSTPQPLPRAVILKRRPTATVLSCWRTAVVTKESPERRNTA